MIGLPQLGLDILNDPLANLPYVPLSLASDKTDKTFAYLILAELTGACT